VVLGSGTRFDVGEVGSADGADPTDNYAPTTATITKNVLNKEITLAPTP
jgi:hypothetical protein